MEATHFGVIMSENRKKLKNLVMDLFLLEEPEFRFDLLREDVEAWDSLGVVSISVGVQETFGYHFTHDEALSVKGVQDIINLLETKGITFGE
jgi:acyl carrier protein|tara:strand:+ start:454 stop:729 length:276 start_codon:yes stop_codon:yes gene_type:complete